MRCGGATTGGAMTVTSVITTDLAIALVRAVVGLVIAAHGAQKVLGIWGGPGLAGWTQGVTRMGMRPAAFWAWVSAFAELAGGVAFARAVRSGRRGGAHGPDGGCDPARALGK